MVKKCLKSWLVILLIFTIIIMLSGCWNYRETNQFYLVGGVSVDYNQKEGDYILGVEAVKVTGAEAQPEGEMYYARGRTLFDGIRDFVIKAGRRLYWGHAKVLVISKGIAETGIAKILDIAFRDAEISSDMWVLISGEDSAGDILEAKRREMHNLNSYQIMHTMGLRKHSSKYYDFKLWQTVKDLYQEGISPVLPIAKLYGGKGGGERIDISGTAVLKGDIMVGVLDEIETQTLLILKKKLKGGVITVPITAGNSKLKTTLKVYESKTKIEPVIKDDNIRVLVDSKITVGISELDGVLNITDRNIRRQIELQSGELIEQRINSLVKKVQNEYRSDIFGFGRIIIDKYPKFWKNKQREWDKLFPGIEMETKVEVIIKNISLARSPISISD